MNLYLISQDENRGYDTYDSAVVAAESEDAARATHPSGGVLRRGSGDWANTSNQVCVEFLGVAKEGTEAGVICASFNAG